MVKKYPLQQIVDVKRKRVDSARKLVKQRQMQFDAEDQKLQKLEQERDKVLNHYQDKLTQIREALDTGLASDRVVQMKVYLKLVKEKLVNAEEQVAKQMSITQKAKEQLDIALNDLQCKRIDEEKMNLHQEEWEKKRREHIAKQEEKEQDEVGQAFYESRRREKKEL